MALARIFPFFLFLGCVVSNCATMKVLIFGGNGFIGAETARLLLHEGHELTLVSRGKNWPWDTSETIRPFVNHVKCDRYKPESCEFWKIIANLDQQFDAVIDFSAYRLRAVKPFYERLKGASKRYIYISSDSVYEVCGPRKSGEYKEEDAIRPSDENIQQELNSKDSYGHKKLEIEEFLREERQNRDGVPYVFLRLPDVLGPRDSTDRIWKYHLWLKYSDKLQKPVSVPSFAENLKTSYIYVKDVARSISKILSDPAIKDEVYNLAFEEPKKLQELLGNMGRLGLGLNDKDINKRISKGPGEWFFPSVTRGAINIEKAKKELNFTPTSWEVALGEIADFYESAMWKFPEERDDIINELLADLGLKSNKEIRSSFLNAILADAAKKPRIEL